MVGEKDLTIMKYIRTYGDYNSWKLDYSDASRGFRLKPTLYKYSDVSVESKILLETDDPRKHGDSTYMEITLDSDVEFSFYIGNAPDDTQTTMNCSIDWGDGVIEDKNITADDKGFKLSHNYKAGSYKIELYDVERNYSISGGSEQMSLISHSSSVKRVILGSRVVSIKVGAFAYCSSLTSVYISEGVTSIEIRAFQYCSSLTSVYISEGVTSIGGGVFEKCTSLVSVYIPESVTSIGLEAFRGCESLKSVNIPCEVVSIGDSVFYDCFSLTSVYISEGVTIIGDTMFLGCISLKLVNIPNSVTNIKPYAFCGLSLKSIDIPEKVTSIGNYAFDSCSSLISISSLNTTAPTIGNNVFDNMPTNGTLYIKPGATGYDAWLNQLPSGWRIVEGL